MKTVEIKIDLRIIRSEELSPRKPKILGLLWNVESSSEEGGCHLQVKNGAKYGSKISKNENKVTLPRSDDLCS